MKIAGKWFQHLYSVGKEKGVSDIKENDARLVHELILPKGVCQSGSNGSGAHSFGALTEANKKL
jgi:hypothetical protein